MKGRWVAVLGAAGALGLALHLALLTWGAALEAKGQKAARPEWEYRVADIRQTPPLHKMGSKHLAWGWAIVLKPGQDEVWRCLVRRHAGSAETEVVKKIKRLKRGLPAEVLWGLSKSDNPIWVPRVTQASKTIRVEATAYDPGPVDKVRGYVGDTSIGLRARFGIVAVDPRVIRYRSLLYVEGYGIGLAGDTGGAIKGKRVDLCYNTTREAFAWGRKKVNVYVLGSLPKARAKEILEKLPSKR